MSKLDFKDLVVLITGAGGGIGRSYAHFFAPRGAKVVINDVNAANADKVVAEVKALGGQAVAAVGSVTEGQKIVDAAVAAFGTVHVLLNNAGILRDQSFRKMTEKQFDDIVDIHLTGAFSMTKAVWPLMRKQKFGRIVNTSSPAGIYGNAGQTNYSAAKMGLITFSRVLSFEGVKYDIKANTIAPLAASPMTETVMTKEVLEHLTPDFIAPLIGVLTAKNGPDVKGRTFELGAGYYGEIRWQESAGYTFKVDDSFTPSAVDHKWNQVKDFTKGSKYPDVTDGSEMMEILELQPKLPPNEQGPPPPDSFKGYTIIITGAGGGLGRAYALHFARFGANVVINDIAEGPAQETVDLVNKAGGVGAVAVGFVPQDAAKIVQVAVDKFGGAHALINNAGILRDKAFVNMTEQSFTEMINIHLKGSWAMSKAVWPIFHKQNYGRIVNTSSPNGVNGAHGQANYATAKAAIIGFTRSLAIEGRKNNILVNALAPSAGTAMTATVWPKEMLEMFKPDTVAPIVAFLASQRCHDTGTIIKTQGGRASEYRWERAFGVVFPNDKVPTAEEIAAKWKEVTYFDKRATHPKNNQESKVQIVGNFNNRSDKARL
ncbi:hypothetical protein Q8F55_006087 [Vanrija albida]|uniref:Ketoreductase domain-containing protein n=1 Tax=Vanrija albida TaxID=181172 RepID=A0ABR3Q3E5_9TREE